MNFNDLTLDEARRSPGNKWNRFDADVIPSWVADMDFPVAKPIRDFIIDQGMRGDLKYTGDTSGTSIVDVFAERMLSKYGWNISSQDVDQMIDIVQGIYIAISVFCEPNDEVIINTPMYFPILQACRDLGRRMLFNPLVKQKNRWEIDFDQLEAKITERTKLLMLVNPHNPSGRVFTRTELQQFADIALRHNLYVVADEIHCDLLFSDGGTHIPFASLGKDIANRTVTFNSATKSHNLGGVRCAIVHFGSDDVRKRFESISPRLRGGRNVVGNIATRIAWQQCSDWLSNVMTYLEENRNHMQRQLNILMPDIKHIPNQATFLAWLDCSALNLGEDPFAFFLREARVAFSAGPTFGPEGENHVRLNFATSRQILDEKLNRMAHAINQR